VEGFGEVGERGGGRKGWSAIKRPNPKGKKLLELGKGKKWEKKGRNVFISRLFSPLEPWPNKGSRKKGKLV